MSSPCNVNRGTLTVEGIPSSIHIMFPFANDLDITGIIMYAPTKWGEKVHFYI